jgi:hypothetical protein
MTLTSDQIKQIFYNGGSSLIVLSGDLRVDIRELLDSIVDDSPHIGQRLNTLLETTAKIAAWHNDFTKQRDFGNENPDHE